MSEPSEKDSEFKVIDYRGDGRLKAHHISKRLLAQFSATKRVKAIEAVKATAKKEILRIRNAERNYMNGNLHGFWTQQFANAELILSEIK